MPKLQQPALSASDKIPANAIVKSAERALAVLEFFDEVRQPATATGIRMQLGMPPSSTTALLRSLVELGYLSYDGRTRLYAPTLRVALLGDWLHGSTPADRRLYRLVDDIGRQTGQLVVLGTRCGTRAQYVYVLRSTESARRLKRGTFAPLARTSVGWVLLREMADRQISGLVHRLNAEEEAPERVPPHWLIDRVNEVRENGYAFCFGKVTPDVGAVAMPLPAAPGNLSVVLAVSGTGPAFVSQKQAYLDTMRSMIADYEQDLRQMHLPPDPCSFIGQR
ncbi:MAG: helix-turn-helix domain-containing protein [Pseudomonadota bacterium]